jgi:hypothetical protein
MNCSDANALLDLMHDDELEPKDAALLLEHLNGCAPCSAELDSLQNLRDVFRTARASTPAAPESMMARISNELAAEPQVAVSRKKRAVPYVVAGLSSLVASVVVLVMSFAPQMTSTPIMATTLIDETPTGAASESLGRSTNSQLGFEMHYIQFAGWRAERIAALPSTAHVARVDFAPTTGTASGDRSLTCYQGLAGTIQVPADAAKISIGKRTVATGVRAKLSYAVWTENERDYLLVSSMPQADLIAMLGG